MQTVKKKNDFTENDIIINGIYYLLTKKCFIGGSFRKKQIKKREENKKGKEDLSKMEKSKNKNIKEEQVLWNKQTSEPCVELL